MYIKDFDKWNEVKKRIQSNIQRVNIRKGEIRWAAIGVNIGSEIDGKGASFTRPVLILHVIGSHLALVVPISTKVKDVSGYVSFLWKDKTNALCVHQMRTVSQKRLLNRIGKISNNKLVQFTKVITRFYSM